MTDFNYLPFNKTCIFSSPITSSSTDEICRTGTLNHEEKDDDTYIITSFLNACLYSCSKKFLTSRDEEDRIKQVAEFKSLIFKKIQEKEPFTNYMNSFISTFLEILSLVFNFIEDDDDENLNDVNETIKDISDLLNKDKELYKIICNLITFESFEKIINKSKKKWEDRLVETFRSNMMSEAIKFINYEEILDDIEENKSNYIKRKICYFIDLIIDRTAFFQVEPKLPKTLNNTELLDMVSEYFDCDIYFLDSMTKKPIFIDNYKIKNRNSIILLSFGLTHFETVGRYNKNNKIQREFKPYDDIIKSMKSPIQIKDKDDISIVLP